MMGASPSELVPVPSWHYEEQGASYEGGRMELAQALAKCYDIRRARTACAYACMHTCTGTAQPASNACSSLVGESELQPRKPDTRRWGMLGMHECGLPTLPGSCSRLCACSRLPSRSWPALSHLPLSARAAHTRAHPTIHPPSAATQPLSELQSPWHRARAPCRRSPKPDLLKLLLAALQGAPAANGHANGHANGNGTHEGPEAGPSPAEVLSQVLGDAAATEAYLAKRHVVDVLGEFAAAAATLTTAQVRGLGRSPRRRCCWRGRAWKPPVLRCWSTVASQVVDGSLHSGPAPPVRQASSHALAVPPWWPPPAPARPPAPALRHAGPGVAAPAAGAPVLDLLVAAGGRRARAGDGGRGQVPDPGQGARRRLLHLPLGAPAGGRGRRGAESAGRVAGGAEGGRLGGQGHGSASGRQARLLTALPPAYMQPCKPTKMRPTS